MTEKSQGFQLSLSLNSAQSICLVEEKEVMITPVYMCMLAHTLLCSAVP